MTVITESSLENNTFSRLLDVSGHLWKPSEVCGLLPRLHLD
jgi:hypothetical protein